MRGWMDMNVPVKWPPGSITPVPLQVLPAKPRGSAEDINEAGQTVGYLSDISIR